MLRFVVRQSDEAPLIHAQEPVVVSFRTFDDDLIGLERFLRFADYEDKLPIAREHLRRQLVGVELL